MRFVVAAASCLVLINWSGSMTAAQDPPPADAPDVYELRSALVLPPVGRGGRRPVHEDAVEAEIVAGTWSVPTEGDEVTLPDGSTRAWTAMEAAENGWVQHQALRGGYALMTYEAAQTQVMLLDARGHSMVYVNGEPRAGDPYNKAFQQLPVLIHEGLNTFLFRVGRGQVMAKLVEPTSRAMLSLRDRTVPDLVVGEDEPVLASGLVINVTTEPLTGLQMQVDGPDGERITTPLPAVAPLTVRRVGFEMPGAAPAAGDRAFALQLVEPIEHGQLVIHDTADLTLAVRQPASVHRRTFRSDIDGSVQYYAVRPAVPAVPDPTDAPDAADALADAAPPALVLTLHGAGVEANGQARCYRGRPWCHVVAPTNRRAFGFDWEDWGRLDAMEVLALAEQRYGTDPRRTYLTGHSMGGHGTWHVGVTFPDRFAAIAPSAGWVSFWSYTGAAEFSDEEPIRQVLRRATRPSDTLALSRNYLHGGVYVLHGDRDDNVPVDQARTMRTHLAGFHTNFAYYERPGAGHWWGNACVDWPPMFDFLQQNTIPARESVRHVEFVTASPGVSASCHWLTIEGQQQDLEISRVDVRLDASERQFRGTTENVSRLAIDLAGLPLEPGEPVSAVLDEQTVQMPWPRDADPPTLHLRRDGAGAWSITRRLDPAHKGPHRYGTFKDAFRNRVVLVYGTGGNADESAWAWAKARYDAETFGYRANGSVDLVADTAFDPEAEPDRNVVLYGNADTNHAWSALLPGSPVQVRRGRVTVGDRRLPADDLGVLLIQPRPGSDVASVGVVTGSGASGMRLTDRLPYFVSGVGYPDLIVLSPAVLADGADGVVAAGFFGDDWSVRRGEIHFAE